MDAQTLSLDQTYESLCWVSTRPPDLHIRRILFYIPRRNERDYEWVDRLMHATLTFECRMVDAGRQQDQARSTSGGVRMHDLIAPHTVQPLFDIDRHWRFQAPLADRSSAIGKPRWEIRVWLEGFELRDGESATLMLTTNAQSVDENPGIPPSVAAARSAMLRTGHLADRRS